MVFRPVFFRLPAPAPLIWSGWKTETGAFVCDEYTRDVMKGVLSPAPQWLQNAPDSRGRIEVPQAQEALRLGDRVFFASALDFEPSGHVEAGERGVVASVDPETGAVAIKLELLHLDMVTTHDCIILRPNYDDYVLQSLRVYPSNPNTACAENAITDDSAIIP